MALLRCAAKFDPFLSLDCAPTPSTLTQSKERKGSNFAIWQPCAQVTGEPLHPRARPQQDLGRQGGHLQGLHTGTVYLYN